MPIEVIAYVIGNALMFILLARIVELEDELRTLKRSQKHRNASLSEKEG